MNLSELHERIDKKRKEKEVKLTKNKEPVVEPLEWGEKNDRGDRTDNRPLHLQWLKPHIWD